MEKFKVNLARPSLVAVERTALSPQDLAQTHLETAASHAATSQDRGDKGPEYCPCGHALKFSVEGRKEDFMPGLVSQSPCWVYLA